MHRLQLKHYLEAAGVPEDRYLLVGVDPPRPVREGAFVVRPNERKWEVLVWRPTAARPAISFLTEAQACEYVLDMLTVGAGVPDLRADLALPPRDEAPAPAAAVVPERRRPADLGAAVTAQALLERPRAVALP
jgi:hypothetical protein